MSCKLDLKTPIYCFGCDPLDKNCYECRAGSENCEMYERFHYAYNFTDYMKTVCTCCFGCRHATATKVKNAEAYIKAEVEQKATVKCSECNSRIYYTLSFHDNVFYTTEEIHAFVKHQRRERINCSGSKAFLCLLQSANSRQRK
jgi:hypothetical protein